MTKSQIKKRAEAWLKQVEKIIEEHGTIESTQAVSDEFEGVGIGLGNLKDELETLIDS